MRYVRTCTGLGLAALAALLLTGCSREGADWKAATLTNTTEAYQVFLQQHPHAAHAADAQARLQQLLEQRDWQLASAADTRDAYQQFVTQHPDSKWVQEARLRIENFAQAGVSGGSALPAAGTPAIGTPATGTAAAGVVAAGEAADSTAGGPASRARVASSAAHGAVAAHGVHRRSPALLARRHGGSRLVQLGAFRSKARAESEWRLLAARFSTLRRLQPHYVAARSRSGRVIRLQVRMSSSAAASGLCATLRKHARACMRVNA